ncbi:hypothetical protein [Citricoccus muralis]|uniref:hypothetical protein n=1 Tax=Citricoccus muralis TaxID=169134 RepID=UPI000E239E77|nr:hypothetical protein [Citricoccus muralis]
MAGEDADAGPLPDILWLEPDATAKDESDLESYWANSIAFYLTGHYLPAGGRRAADDADHDFYGLLNTHWEPVEYTLPDSPFPDSWKSRTLHSGGLLGLHLRVVIEYQPPGACHRVANTLNG